MPQVNSVCYQFGPYRFDPEERILTLAGETIALTPKAIDILIVLLERAGQLVEKDELLRAVWPDTFVEEANLTQNVFMLRRALGDQRAEPTYIETVTRRGYRFVGAVKTVERGADDSASAALVEVVASQAPIIAVLPFVNTAGNPDVEYLTDGLAINIINNLSRISGLRVMSRSSVLRYRSEDVNPQQVGKGLGATAVLTGKMESLGSVILVSVELVDVGTGWQMWGETFDTKSNDLLRIQELIIHGLVGALKLIRSRGEPKNVSTRYTPDSNAYEAYLEGRRQASAYTKTGIEKAIRGFHKAISLDPNYALAYTAVIDCYLRLTTNYLHPEHDRPAPLFDDHSLRTTPNDAQDLRVKLRFEWDWKSAERELHRANDLGIDYPAPHQWYAAYRYSQELLRNYGRSRFSDDILEVIESPQLYFKTLGSNEEIQVLCAVAREQIEIGNYNASCLILERYWTPGDWPRLHGLSLLSNADLLFTTGTLSGCLSSTGRISKGQRHAEALLSGSIGLFEHLGAKRSGAEAKIELALSYYRQGMFEPARNMLLRVIKELETGDKDLKALALIRLAVVERHAGHISDSLSSLSEAENIVDHSGALITGRYYHERATALKEATTPSDWSAHSEIIQSHFVRARFEFESIGNLRYSAVVVNNLGYLLLGLGRHDEAEVFLLHAQGYFIRLDDKTRKAQVDDCLSRLYLATGRLEMAEVAIDRAIASLETNDEEALLAEAFTTKGEVLSRQRRYNEAREILEAAWRIAERCGDNEGAGRAILVLIEHVHQLNQEDRKRMILLVNRLLEHTQQASTRARLAECLKSISPT